MRRLKNWMLISGFAGVIGCGSPAPAPAPPATDSAASAPAQAPAEAEEAKSDEAQDKSQPVKIESVFTLPAKDGKPLDVATIKAFLEDPKNHETFIPETPLGLAPIESVIPQDNPLTRAKVELGRLLYFDTRLSRDNTLSCASCHDPAIGWAQNTPFAEGINGQFGNRNSPTAMNRAYGKTQFWDGRAASLEEQSLGPIENPVEMGFTVQETLERLKASEGYKLFFDKVFDGQFTPENLAKAIASFERLVLTGGSKYDYQVQAQAAKALSPDEIEELDPEVKERVKKQLADAEAHALSESAERGMKLYFGDKAQCSLCHVGNNLSDELFYNIGVGMDKEDFDKGRAAITSNEAETGAFKTPGLRNIHLTAPYMHDGSQKTLQEVVEYYNKGGHPNPHLDKRIKKLNLTEQEIKDLVAFMEEGLASPLPNIPAPRLPE